MKTNGHRILSLQKTNKLDKSVSLLRAISRTFFFHLQEEKNIRVKKEGLYCYRATRSRINVLEYLSVGLSISLCLSIFVFLSLFVHKFLFIYRSVALTILSACVFVLFYIRVFPIVCCWKYSSFGKFPSSILNFFKKF